MRHSEKKLNWLSNFHKQINKEKHKINGINKKYNSKYNRKFRKYWL